MRLFTNNSRPPVVLLAQLRLGQGQAVAVFLLQNERSFEPIKDALAGGRQRRAEPTATAAARLLIAVSG